MQLVKNKYALQNKVLSVRFIVGPNCILLNNMVYIIMNIHPTTIASHAFIETSIKHSLESENIVYNNYLIKFMYFFQLLKTGRSAGKEPLVDWSIVMVYSVSIVICSSSLRWHP